MMASNTKQPILIHSLLETQILNKYDIFLFDANGVFWNGSTLVDSITNEMKELVKHGKKVCVVSNTTSSAESMKKTYEKRGLGVEAYNEFITSGDLLRYATESGNLETKLNKKLKPTKKFTIYIFGKPREWLEDYFYITNNPQEADFIYLSVPQFREEGKIKIIAKHPEFAKYFKLSGTKFRDQEWWDVAEGGEDIFEDTLKELSSYKKPFVNANPDLYANEKDMSAGGQRNSVVRNGYVANKLKIMGHKVVEYGKPSSDIFEFAIKQIFKGNIAENNILKEKIIMIGDTRGTDIDGAKNFGIDSVLMSTGNEAKIGLEGKNSGATYFFKVLE